MIVVLVIVIAVRQRAHRQPQPTVQHGISPVNNPAFNEPEAEYSTMIYDEIKIGPVMPPQYDTVEFAHGEYASIGPHAVYDSVDTEA